MRGLQLLAAYTRDTLPNMIVVLLIGTADLRARKVRSMSHAVRLEIAELAELVNMFHLSRATDLRDKVFALLGMLKDGIEYSQLTPNYKISWDVVFERLIRTFMGQEVLVITEHSSEQAIIKGQGFILGTAYQAGLRHDGTIGGQRFNLINTGIEKATAWYTSTSAHPVQDNDIVCLLRGAHQPCVLRPCRDFFIVIAILSEPPRNDAFGNQPERRKNHHKIDWALWSYDESVSLCNFILVWDWSLSTDSTASQQLLLEVDFSSFPLNTRVDNISGLSSSSSDILSRLEEAVLAKEQARFRHPVRSNIMAPYSILLRGDLRSHRTLQDLMEIHHHLPFDGTHGNWDDWLHITSLLVEDLKRWNESRRSLNKSPQGISNHDTRFQSDLERVTRLVRASAPTSRDILEFIRARPEQCFAKISNEHPEALLRMFRLAGDTVPFTSTVIKAALANPDANTIFRTIDKHWHRTHELTLSYDVMDIVVRERLTETLEMLVDRCKDQIGELLATTDLGKLTAVIDSVTGSDMLGIFTEAFATDEPSVIDQVSLQHFASLYHKAYALDDEAIDVLIADGIDLNIRDGNFESILHKATLEEDEAIVTKLVNTGRVSIDVENSFGKTPLQCAVDIYSATSIAISLILVSHGADLDKTDLDEVKKQDVKNLNLVV